MIPELDEKSPDQGRNVNILREIDLVVSIILFGEEQSPSVCPARKKTLSNLIIGLSLSSLYVMLFNSGMSREL